MQVSFAFEFPISVQKVFQHKLAYMQNLMAEFDVILIGLEVKTCWQDNVVMDLLCASLGIVYIPPQRTPGFPRFNQRIILNPHTPLSALLRVLNQIIMPKPHTEQYGGGEDPRIEVTNNFCGLRPFWCGFAFCHSVVKVKNIFIPLLYHDDR